MIRLAYRSRLDERNSTHGLGAVRPIFSLGKYCSLSKAGEADSSIFIAPLVAMSVDYLLHESPLGYAVCIIDRLGRQKQES